MSMFTKKNIYKANVGALEEFGEEEKMASLCIPQHKGYCIISDHRCDH